MNRYRVYAYLPGGGGLTFYDGYVDVHAETEDEAIQRAKKDIQRNHGQRQVKVTKVERTVRQ